MYVFTLLSSLIRSPSSGNPARTIHIVNICSQPQERKPCPGVWIVEADLVGYLLWPDVLLEASVPRWGPLDIVEHKWFLPFQILQFHLHVECQCHQLRQARQKSVQAW